MHSTAKTLTTALWGCSLVTGIAVPNPDAGSAPYAKPGDKRSLFCPSIWTTVVSDLRNLFGGCSDNARAAIRTSFHDCFPGTVCDGSLILANECSGRPENQQMISICSSIGSVASQYNVSTADTIQAAAALGIVTCGGPTIQFLVGRTDSSTPSPTGQMPAANADAATQISDFNRRGFSAFDLVALVGAHSAAKNLAGQALDTTDTELDTLFYKETLDQTAPASLDSDRFLSNTSGTTQDTWKTFANVGGWSAAFVPAMQKMATLGNDVLSMTDCTSVISA